MQGRKQFRKLRQLLCLLLAALLVYSTVPMESAFASETETEAMESSDSQAGDEEEVEAPEDDSGDSGEEEAEPAESIETESVENTEPETYANRISGMLWLDMHLDIEQSIYSGDGTRQAEEEPLAGYTVYLYNSEDTANVIQKTTTDTDGTYEFTDLEPGDYIVGVKTETMVGVEYLLPFFYLDGTEGDNRFVATYDEEADAYLFAYTASITMDADTVVTDMNAGMRTPPRKQLMSVTWFSSNGSSYYNLAAAVNATPAGGTITAYGGTEDLSMYATNYIYINKSVTINAGGATITATAGLRHFIIRSGATLTLRNITLDGNNNAGGGISVGDSTYGGTRTGYLTLDTGTVIKNCYNDSFGYSSGEAVWVSVSSSTLTMNTGATITGSSGRGVTMATGTTFTMAGGTISSNKTGVAVGTSCTFNMSGGTITGNDIGTGYGGGVYMSSGTFTMSGTSTVTGNKAGNGGGVYVNGGTFIMNNTSAVTNNTATTNGGGIYTVAGGTVNINNTATITGNKATNGSGGGIYTANTTNYSNLNIAVGVTFGTNSAKDAVLPPANASSFTTIKTTSSTIYHHPINSYDINTPTYYQVTVRYVDANANSVGSPSSAVYYAATPFSLPTSLIPNPGVSYTYQGYKLNTYAAGNALDGTGAPANITLAGTLTIYLVFAQPYTLTEKFVDLSGNPVVGLPDNPVTVTGSYTASGIPASYTVGSDTYTYLGYKFDTYTSGDALSSGTPSAVAITSTRDVYYVYGLLVNVAVSKTVTGAYGDPNKEFEVTITLTDTGGTPVAGSYNYTGSAISGVTPPASSSIIFNASGQGTIRLKHGQTVTIEDIPQTYTCTVQETDGAVSGGIYDVTYSGTGTVTGSGSSAYISETLGATTATVSITNDRTTVPTTGLSGTNDKLVAVGILTILTVLAVAVAMLFGYRRRRKCL